MSKNSNNTFQQLSPERFVRERGRAIPLEACYLDKDSLKEHGQGIGVIVRQHKGGKRTIGSYLIDAWCFGVKDVFYLVRMESDEYEGFFEQYIQNRGMERVPYEELHNWVFGALEFAAEAGIGPHKDFAVAKYLLEDDEDERVPIIEYEFGFKGKHHLVCHTLAELERYMPILDANLGKGDYTWAMDGFGPEEEYEDDEVDETEEDEDRDILFSEESSTSRFTLRIDIEHVKPLVWRKLEVPSNLTLAGLHRAIQASFGWWDEHLHAFRTKNDSIDEDRESTTSVRELFRQKGDKLIYEYDFGDGWVHKVELVSDPVPTDDRTIRVLGGKGACPPEDIGGPWRYSQLLEILASGDKRKLKKEFGGEILDWLPEGFDPAEFDVEDTQAELDDAFGQEAK